jgi:hypothetical protein
MSPELFEAFFMEDLAGTRINWQLSDFYSTGLVLLEATTLARVAGLNAKKVDIEELNIIKNMNFEYPKCFKIIITQMLKVNPKERLDYSHALKLLDEELEG